MSSQGSSLDKLIYMANQIGKFFVSQDEAGAVEGIATHLKKFWDPRMRSAIVAHVQAGGAGLEPHVRKAVESLITDTPPVPLPEGRCPR
jgi:formate dehydrogenase subunit delta